VKGCGWDFFADIGAYLIVTAAIALNLEGEYLEVKIVII
jgi:hypothetical protein